MTETEQPVTVGEIMFHVRNLLETRPDLKFMVDQALLHESPDALAERVVNLLVEHIQTSKENE